MDGTLLNEQGVVTDATAAAVRATPIPLTLVSARAPMEMAAAISKLDLRGPQIGFNGGLIYRRRDNAWETISERVIAPDVAAAIVEGVRTHFPEVSVSFYDRDAWYAENDSEELQFEMRLTNQQPHFQNFATLFANPNLQVFKIMLITFNDETMAALNAYFKQAGWPGVAVQQSGTAYLEVTSSEAKKSRGIQYILDREHLQAEDTAAFGDGHNDLPMLKMVGLPVVMANALPAIKTVAAHVTKANTADGIAYALQNYAEFQS